MKTHFTRSCLLTTIVIIFSSCGTVKSSPDDAGVDADAGVDVDAGGSQDCTWEQSNWDECNWAP